MTAFSTDPSPKKIEQAVDMFLELRDFLRAEPPAEDVLRVVADVQPVGARALVLQHVVSVVGVGADGPGCAGEAEGA